MMTGKNQVIDNIRDFISKTKFLGYVFLAFAIGFILIATESFFKESPDYVVYCGIAGFLLVATGGIFSVVLERKKILKKILESF